MLKWLTFVTKYIVKEKTSKTKICCQTIGKAIRNTLVFFPHRLCFNLRLRKSSSDSTWSSDSKCEKCMCLHFNDDGLLYLLSFVIASLGRLFSRPFSLSPASRNQLIATTFIWWSVVFKLNGFLRTESTKQLEV